MSNFDSDKQDKASSFDGDYELAMSKIVQLEEELQQRDKALEINLKEQVLLRERLAACINTIRETTGQLNFLESDLKDHYKQIIDRVDELEQENRDLNSSNDAWSSRSIKLEFEVLTAQEKIKTIKIAHDLAVNRISLLEFELKSIKTDNNRRRRQSDKTVNAWSNDINRPKLI
jgi:chromosome segregation ATPase